MPFDKITITLNDVSTLLHIPVCGMFFSLEGLIRDATISVLVEILGVTHLISRERTQGRGGFELCYVKTLDFQKDYKF